MRPLAQRKKENNMRKLTRFRLTFAVALLAAVALMQSFRARAATASIGDSEQLSDLLTQVKWEALELRNDAEKMDSFTRSGNSWMSFATKVNEIREHVNKTGKLIAQLTEARDTGSPWQQQAIDHILPALKELAANTTLTIDHLNNNKNVIHNEALQRYCGVNYELARELVALITDFMDYGETEAKFADLQRKVGSH